MENLANINPTLLVVGMAKAQTTKASTITQKESMPKQHMVAMLDEAKGKKANTRLQELAKVGAKRVGATRNIGQKKTQQKSKRTLRIARESRTRRHVLK